MSTTASDLIERLRDTPCTREPFTPAHADCQCRVANDAADEIERLRRTILSALDCLHHNDTKGARRVLSKDD